MDLSSITSKTELPEPTPSTSAVADPLPVPDEPIVPHASTSTDPLPTKSKTAKNGEEIFFVDKILKKRVNNKGDILYYVKWKSYDSKHNTWEPATSFHDVAVIENWEAKRKRGKKMKRGGGKARKAAKPVSDSSSGPSDSCSVSTKSSFHDPEPSESSCDIVLKTKPAKKAKRVPRKDRAGGLSPEASTSASTSIAGSVIDGKKQGKKGQVLEKGLKKTKKKTGLSKIKEEVGESRPEAKKVTMPVKMESPSKVSKMDLLLSQKKLTPEKVANKRKKTGVVKKKLEFGSSKKKLKNTEKEGKKKAKVPKADKKPKDVPVPDEVVKDFSDMASRDFAEKYMSKSDPSVMVEMTIIKDGDKEILFEEIRFGPGAVRRSEPLRQ